MVHRGASLVLLKVKMRPHGWPAFELPSQWPESKPGPFGASTCKPGIPHQASMRRSSTVAGGVSNDLLHPINLGFGCHVHVSVLIILKKVPLIS
jgi:hypothetical protein